MRRIWACALAVLLWLQLSVPAAIAALSGNSFAASCCRRCHARCCKPHGDPPLGTALTSTVACKGGSCRCDRVSASPFRFFLRPVTAALESAAHLVAQSFLINPDIRFALPVASNGPRSPPRSPAL